MSYEDERIVKLSFDNEAFKKGVADTLVALKNLENALDVDPKTAAKSFDNLSVSVNETERELSNLEKGIDKVKLGFTALEVAGITVFSNLTTAAMQFGKSLYSQTLGQITGGGFSRALNLENAKFQIEGLDKSWNTLKEDILYGVKDTAYGLDEAARVASQLSASNIEAGDQMKISLRAISGVAAMTNSSYSDIGQIFTTMAAQGRVMGHELTRLSYRGLNAAAAIAKYNKEIGNSALDTEAKVRDMASKGQISYQQFANAMNKVFGDHATEANKTFTGALSNMRAALSRLGEAFQSPQLDLKRRLAVSVIPVIDKISEALKKFTVPAFSKLVDMAAEWGEKLLSNYSFMNFIYNVVMGVYSWIHNIIRALWELGGFVPEAKDLAHSLAEMTNWMVLNGERGEKFRNVIKAIARGFQTLLMVIDAIVYILEPLYKPVLNFLKSTVSSVADASSGAEDFFTKIQNGIKIIAYFMRLGLEVFLEKIVKTIKTIIVVLKLFGLAIGSIIVIIIKLVQAIKNFVVNVFTYIKQTLAGIEWLQNACIKVYEVIIKIFENLGKGIKSFSEFVLTSMGFVWNKIGWLFQDHTMKAKVVVDTVYTDIDSSSVDNATKSMDEYTTAATDAAKAGKTASGKSYVDVSATGGKLQGKFGVKLNNQFWNDVQEKIGEVDDQTKNADKSIDTLGKSVSDSVSVIDKTVDNSSAFSEDKDNFATRFASRINAITAATSTLQSSSPAFSTFATIVLSGMALFVSSLEVMFDGIVKILESSSKAIPALSEGIVDGVISAFKRLNSALPQMLRDFATALSAISFPDLLKAVILMGGVITSIFAIAAASRIADPKFFRSITITLLAFGAVIATIGIISYFVSPTAFKTVMESINWFLLIFAGLMAILTVWKAIGTFKKTCKKIALGISDGFKALANAISNMKLIDIKKTNTVWQLGELLRDLALLIGVIAGFVVGITVYLDKFGGEDSIKHLFIAAGLIVGMITAVFLIISLVVGILGEKTKTKSVMTAAGRIFGKKDINRTVESSMSGIVALIGVLTSFIGTISAAVFALSFRDPETIATSFALIMGSVFIMLGSVLGIIIYMTEGIVKKRSFWEVEKAPAKLSSLLKSTSLFMVTIAKVIATFVIAAKVLETVKPDRLKQISILFGVIMVGVTGLLFSYFGVVKLLSSIKPTDATPSLLKITIILSGFMMVMGLMMNLIASAVSKLSKSDENTLNTSAAIIGGILVAIGGMFMGIMAMSSKLGSIRVDKAASISVTIGQMAATLGILVGAITSIVTVVVALTKVIDSLSDTTSIIWSISIISGIFTALTVFYLIINKTANLMPSIQSVYGLAVLSVAMTIMIMGIAGFMKVIDTIDLNWKTIVVTIGSIGTALISMIALSKFVSGGALVAIATGWKGLLIIAGFIASIAAIIALIGRTIGYVGENINILANSFKELANVPWKALSDITEDMKTCIGNVITAMVGTLKLKNIAGVIALSIGLEMLADAVKNLAKVNPEQLTAFTNTVTGILAAFASNWQGALIALAFAALFSAIGWSLAIGMVGFIIFAALVPVMVAAVNTAIKSLNNLGELAIDVKKYMTIIEDLMPLSAELAIFGVLLSIGGVGLAIGAAALIAAVWLLGKAYGIMDTDMSDMKKAIKYLDKLATLAVWSLFDGWILSSGAGMLAIGAILLIAAVGIMKGVYKIMKTDFKKIEMAIAYLGGIGTLSGLCIAVGIALSTGAGTLMIGSIIFLIASGALALSLLAMQKIFDYVDFDSLKAGLSGIENLCSSLLTLGEAMKYTLPPLIEGMFMLAIAMGGFAVAGIEFMVGAGTFGLGLSLLQKAFEVVDPNLLLEKIGSVLEFVSILAIAGIFMSIALIPFTVAAALFALGAVFITTGILTFALSLIVAAAALNIAVPMLQPAFDSLTEMFTNFDLLDILAFAGKIILFSAAIVAAGLLLSLGGVPFLIGTTMLLLASAMIYTSIEALSKALDNKKVSRILINSALLIGAILLFGILSPVLITIGALFVVFAQEIYDAADKLEKASEKVNNAAEMFEDSEEKGKNAVLGFALGLADKAGLTDIWNAGTEMGQSVLDSLDKVLDEHSPSRETFDRALNAVAGFLNGFGVDGDKVADAVRPLGYSVCDTLDSFGNPISSIGEALGLTGGNSLLNGLSTSLFGENGMQSLLKTFGQGWGAGLSSIFNMGNQAAIDEARKMQKYYFDLAEEAGKNGLADLAGTYKQQEAMFKAQADELEAQKSIFDIDIPDFGEWYPTTTGGGGGETLSPDTSEALSSLNTTGNGASDLAKSAGTNVGKSITNNNYNFIQNNYSPEPIDRTELYVQTQNQLDAWYKFVRDN